MLMPSIAQAPAPTPADYTSGSRELLENHIAFRESRNKVARLLLETMDRQNELGTLTSTEQDLMYHAIYAVLDADQMCI